MTRTQAMAEVFWTAFKALSNKEQDAVVIRLAQDKRLREDLIDIAIGYERQGGPTYPLEEVLQEIEQRKQRSEKLAGKSAKKTKSRKAVSKKAATKKKTSAKKYASN